MSVNSIIAAGSTSSSNGPGLELWIPPAAGAVAAFAIVAVAGVIAWRMSNGVHFRDWFVGSVYAGPAWTAKDSWVTNIGAVGAILGIVVTDSGTTLKNVILPTPAAGVTLLFILFGGASAAAPVVYGATAKIESQGITDTAGSVWGFLLAGAVSSLVVLGEMATIGLLVWSIVDSTATKWSITVALGLGAAGIISYSVRSLMYFATLPAPRPKKDPTTGTSAATYLGVHRSLLGNRTFSATL